MFAPYKVQVYIRLMNLGDEKYMLLTTYKKDQTPVPTPVWLVPVTETSVGFWTSSGSGKAKRLARTSKVSVQACDARGRVTPGSTPMEAVARTASSDEFEAIKKKVKKKYGFMVQMSSFLNTVGGTIRRRRIPYGDIGIVVELAN